MAPDPTTGHPGRSPYAPPPSAKRTRGRAKKNRAIVEPKLEAVDYKPKPNTAKQNAEIRASVIANQAITAVTPELKASRAGAPGPGLSGYSTLAALLGPDLAAHVPGTIAPKGAGKTVGVAHLGPVPLPTGVVGDAVMMLPFFRGPRLIARGVKAVVTGEKAAEAAKAAEEAAKVAAETPGPLGTPKDVSKNLRRAKTVRRQQEKLYHQERGKRAAAVEEAMQANPGVEGYHAALSELKGELPKLHFGGFEDFDQTGTDAVFKHIQDHPTLRPYEKINTQKAVLHVLNGKVPTRSEIKLLENVFGESTTKKIVDSVPFWAKAKHAGLEALNVPRALMASFDVSAPFRQGLMVSSAHPRLFFRNFNSMFRAFGSENTYHAIHDEIASRPTFDLMQKSGLSLTELDGGLTQREEQFVGGNFAERIPVAGHGVRASGRAYTGFLNKTRADFFDLLIKRAEQQGIDPEGLSRAKLAPKGETVAESVAKFVNSATGRGDLGALQSHAVTLNTLFFSPRLLASRLNFMNPVYYARLDPLARQEALKSALGLASTVGTVLYLAKLGGASVNTDPRNADFAKIKLGNTRLDVLGGFQQPMRLLAELASGKVISSTTGKELTLGPQGPGKLSRRDIIQRFLETKLAPVPSFINDAFKGTDFAGQPFSWKKAAYQRMIPLLAQDAADLYTQEGGLLPALGGYALGSFGVGVQTYGPKQKTSPIAGNPYDSQSDYAGSDYSGPSPYAP